MNKSKDDRCKLVGPSDSLSTKEAFECLYFEWKRCAENNYSSNLVEPMMHWAYQRIIGLGPDVVPYILARMKDSPDHWFWALYSITGENPVSKKSEGIMQWMTNDWLDWGRGLGFVE